MEISGSRIILDWTKGTGQYIQQIINSGIRLSGFFDLTGLVHHDLRIKCHSVNLSCYSKAKKTFAR